MSDLAQRLASLSPAQRELLQKRLAKERPPAGEPIAIIGMACRFPGSPNLSAYWKLIHDGRNAACEVPAERWSRDEFFDPTGELAGKMSVQWAALVDQPDQFDPQFFGITPREAARMDPQQRLLLEVAWEAMENAGRPADQMAGSRTAVFVGIGGTDYSKVAVPYDDYYHHIDAHMGTGNALSIAANRLSYIFDFHGPSAAVDTACSSSSLAIHFAVESLRRRESDAALAGGVNMILTPETTIAFSKARMLSPEGVCRPFDAGANGYVRGEGCGLVMLKRLADAERDGDNILAVLRATSVNQDGRTSGISAPNSRSQVACIRQALTEAGLQPDDIHYIEAHGTGTPLGDPIEMQALGEIFRAASANVPPVYISSVKANVGHMETVSGVAGLIKVVLMMQHKEIVRQTHFEKLNPHINLVGTRLVIPADHVDWPASRGPLRAGVSSFGFGGTNTHLIVESVAPAKSSTDSRSSSDRPLHVLKLSAKSEGALAQGAAQLADYLGENSSERLADICYSINTGRADFNHRAAVLAENSAQLRERLKALAGGETPAGTKQATVRTLGRPKIAFLFTGQGLQYPGMGSGLYEAHSVFRESLNACDEILRERWGGKSLLEILFSQGDDPAALLHQTEFTQPALFALEYALAELWRSWGVRPDIVLGHSVGEYAAACVAGAMNLENGLALIAERARLMQNVSRRGKMAVIFAPRERVAMELVKYENVVVAVVNGPENTVISGDADEVDAAVGRFASLGIDARPLNVSHAFHSPLMDDVLEEFQNFAARIDFQAPQIPLISNLTGRAMSGAPSPAYWRDHLRGTVQFAEGVARIAEAKPTMIIEIGPTASLLGMARRCVPNLEAAWLPSLRQGQNDWETIGASLGEFYVRGGRVDWRGWDAPWKRARLILPNYPFERSRHWYTLNPTLKRAFAQDGGGAPATVGESSGHPLLGTRLSTVWSNTLFETSLSARSPAYLVDHQVQGAPVVPAAAYLELGLAAARHAFGEGRHSLANVVIQQAMFLPEGARRRVQISISPEAGAESTFEAYSRASGEVGAAGGNGWSLHATGQLLHEGAASEAPAGSTREVDLGRIRARVQKSTSRDDFYRLMGERTLAYGPSFQVLDNLQRGAEEAIAEIVLPDGVRRDAASYHLHPALGDALLQAVAGIVPLEANGEFSPFTYMPVAIRRVRLVRPFDDLSQPMFAYARRTSTGSEPSPEQVEGDVFLVSGSGEVLVALEGVSVQRLGRASADAPKSDVSSWLYRVDWRASPLPSAVDVGAATSTNAPYLIFADRTGVAKALADRLAQRGDAAILVEAGDRFEFCDSSKDNGKAGVRPEATIDPLDEAHYQRLFDAAFTAKQLACRGIVHLWSLDIPQASVQDKADDELWASSRRLGTGSAMLLARALSRTELAKSPPLWIVTAGAQAVASQSGELPIAVGQTPLLGLGRVASLELADFSPRLVDLDPQNLSADSLLEELTRADQENQIAYRNGERFAARLVHDDALADAGSGDSATALSIPVGKAFQLRITQAGSFDQLRFQAFEREKPQAGQVEIEVRATGLNFSDVLKALGLYPGIKDAIVPLGIEAAGVVTAVGEGVTRFRVGDEVFGVVPYAFASHARTAEYALVHKPKTIDFDEACTIPITFLTAYYGLVRLADLQPGERVLIHAGAGGVGLAAIQIAQHIGAEIFTTAGSIEKRELLHSLGVEHVYSSRSTAFAEEILADTSREGIDVVLNSLPGEAIIKSLGILRAYGRFLEIGKTDIYQNRMIGLLPFQDNLSYFAIDLDRMLRQRPEYIRGLYGDVMKHFERGDYQPLMFTRFETEGTIDAFRYMSQRKNIGKVVVAMEAQEGGGRSIDEPARSGSGVRGDGAYVITGGLGALGLQLADWLSREGAGAVLLLSRSRPSAEARKRIDEIEQRGTRVVALQADVTDRGSLAQALGKLPRNLPPIRGAVHGAGVLDDGILSEMTLDQLDRALAPKVRGAWNLHEATLDQPLDFFLLFSSVASVLGSPGQANYAAGNAMLDGLAHARRAAGLPAISINWGPWASSGMAAEGGRSTAVKSRGMQLIDPQQGFEVLAGLLVSRAPQTAVMDVAWGEMFQMMGNRRPPLLAEIASEMAGELTVEAGSRVDTGFRQRLFAAPEKEREVLVRDYIQQELARIMGVEPGRLETDQPLSTFGLDSLLALELKNNLEGRLDFTLPMAKLMEGPSIASLAQETVKLLCSASGDGKAGGPGGSSRQDETWTPLLALRSSGNRPPLFLLPSLGGDVRCYADLVQRLGDDQPVYAFRPRGVDQNLTPHQTMEEMIADYVVALRALQPSGPYYLGGWSTGGIFAFALAEALERGGDEVALVALFDTPLPSICDDIDLDDAARFLCDIVNFANSFAGTQARVNYEQLRALAPEQRFQTVLAEARTQGTIPADASEDFIRRLVQVGEANVRVIQGYEPEGVRAPVHLFVPLTKGGLAQVSGHAMPDAVDNGWSDEISQRMELHNIPGDHFTMMLADSAARITQRLESLMVRKEATRPVESRR